ncbi:MAG: hypothetical protein WBE89_12600 [Methyloceanibacter sp.]|jgi:hypothetical protein
MAVVFASKQLERSAEENIQSFEQQDQINRQIGQQKLLALAPSIPGTIITSAQASNTNSKIL